MESYGVVDGIPFHVKHDKPLKKTTVIALKKMVKLASKISIKKK